MYHPLDEQKDRDCHISIIPSSREPNFFCRNLIRLLSKNDVIANILLLYDQDCDNSVMHTTNNLIDYHLNYCIMRKIKKTRLQPESMTSTLVLYRRLQTLMNSFAIVVAINAIKDNSCL